MNKEIEIKLAIDEKAIELLPFHPLLQAITPTQHHLISTYFDTTNKQLRKAGFALRIRNEDGIYGQTLKSRAKSLAGLTARDEWDWPLSDFALNLSYITHPDLQKYLSNPAFIADLQPRFTTDFIRTAWLLTLSDNTVVEIALDCGQIIADDRRAPLQELELELKEGEPETLKALAQRLQTELNMQPEDRSKAARGFALIEGKYHAL